MKPRERAALAGLMLIGAIALLLSAGCETYQDNSSELWDQRVDQSEPR